ncbi:MAG: LysM peptidoglycan-binding domain-containing protein [Candidatus Goldiibacteriota bacterium]
MQKLKGLMILVFVLVIAAGCASKSKVKPDEGAAGSGDAYVEESTEKSAEDTMRYVVDPKDTLWDISGDVYGDNFRWPLIYRTNRDSIVDPDFIDVDQQLKIKKDFSESQIRDAVEKAKETPPYEKRSEPRRTLPLQY